MVIKEGQGSALSDMSIDAEYALEGAAGEQVAAITAGSSRSAILPWIVIGVAAIFYCYAYFLRVSPSDMMTQLVKNFHIDAAAFGNLSAFYYYAYTPMQLPVGIIIDRMGARLVLVFACLLAVLGLLVFVVAGDFYLAAVGRFLVGFGSAFAFITVLKLATLWLPPNRFATVAGATTAFGMVAAILSDFYLADFVQKLGYHDALYSCLIAGVVLSVLIFMVVRDRPKQEDGAQMKGMAEKITFNKLLLGMWVMAKKPQMWIIGIMGALLYLPASMFLDLWGIPYLKKVYHATPEQAAGLAAMVFVGWIISAPLIGAYSDKIKRRRLPLTFAALGAACLISVVFYVPHLPLSAVYILLLLFGLFCGAHPLVFSLSRENNPDQLSGTATAITNCLIMLGGVIFQPLVGYLLDLHWRGVMAAGVPVYSSSDFTFALSVLPVSLFFAFILSFVIKETYCKVYS